MFFSGPGQNPLGVGPDQPGQPHRRDAKRRIEFLPEEAAAKVGLIGFLKIAGHQLNRVQIVPILAHGDAPADAVEEIIPGKAGNTALRGGFHVGDTRKFFVDIHRLFVPVWGGRVVSREVAVFGRG